jgi:hypothetical protein
MVGPISNASVRDAWLRHRRPGPFSLEVGNRLRYDGQVRLRSGALRTYAHAFHILQGNQRGRCVLFDAQGSTRADSFRGRG